MSSSADRGVTHAAASDLVRALAGAESLAKLPGVVDVAASAPLNPPEPIQLKFVGRTYEAAYTEAESFVTVVDEFAVKHGPGVLAGLDRIVDFGSGWGPPLATSSGSGARPDSESSSGYRRELSSLRRWCSWFAASRSQSRWNPTTAFLRSYGTHLGKPENG